MVVLVHEEFFGELFKNLVHGNRVDTCETIQPAQLLIMLKEGSSPARSVAQVVKTLNRDFSMLSPDVQLRSVLFLVQ